MLRVGTHDDFDELYFIYMHPSVNPYLGFEIMSKEDFLPIFHELFASGTLYVYENEDKQILATCIVCRGERRFAHGVRLSTFTTNPKYHHQGFGSKFMLAIIDLIRKDKTVKRIGLYTEADNDIALKFYKKFGFQIEGRLKNCYKRPQDEHFVDMIPLAIWFD